MVTSAGHEEIRFVPAEDGVRVILHLLNYSYY